MVGAVAAVAGLFAVVALVIHVGHRPSVPGPAPAPRARPVPERAALPDIARVPGSRAISPCDVLPPPPTVILGQGPALPPLISLEEAEAEGRRGTSARPPMAALDGPCELRPDGDDRFTRRVLELRRRDLDVVLVVHNVYSGGGDWGTVHAGARTAISALDALLPACRLGAVMCRHSNTSRPLCQSGLTTDRGRTLRVLARAGARALPGARGAVPPQAMYDGLNAATRMAWRDGATRAVVLVTDRLPKVEELARIGFMARAFRTKPGSVLHVIYVPGPIEAAVRAAPAADGDPRQMTPEMERGLAQARRAAGEALRTIADRGGGQCVVLADPGRFASLFLSLIFGDQWRTHVAEVCTTLKTEIADEG